MRRELFLRIVHALENHSDEFKLRRDATGRTGLSPLQKCTTAIRQLAYGCPGDSLDEYIRMGDRTVSSCLANFCKCVIEVFGAQYLRSPNQDDIQRLLQLHEQRHGFPGMLGSLDYMHWEWKNCPVAWKGQYTRGDYGVPIVIFEAVASADLWIWHAFFGQARSNNDINVLHGSSLFNAVLQGNSPQVQFTVNGTSYNFGYYLTDGIYPEWASFVKSFPCPMDPKRVKFKERQEAARNDVERAFGVLQSRWTIIRNPARSYHIHDMRKIMLTCIILHNMIIEDEGDKAIAWFDGDTSHSATIVMGSSQEFQAYLSKLQQVTRSGNTSPT
ncbi:uncharacterized protein LOC131025598 [Salvia miltiorrhiza]|uniref:uncharacterized protein LOC131025598 n=1 Tax=Salvia miltiorrhiza TaxID=226208 RepID=UPI0025AD29BF|nr:uncharacterized protein LOC131025598 [Salvia miltiorrhiza]